ncbi:riboflavin synthase [Thorsellia anophelis]|uniref:Riboflavin synthase n=1 Tax=Thorsellia anophelis DSM 18579 TaxID=1123402 RepID=A0A1I0CJK3_9GAMM|nr:riboflavin synthase [Thorsellia anophelis]SET19627.1 riboflavin synthase alpha chain [Thorsellia anophelis DSM 18579]
MFTGLIEQIGTIKSIDRGHNHLKISIYANSILRDVTLGDSIAVNGICLTVTHFTDSYFTVDVMPQTVQASSIKTLKIGDKVNLERALRADSRLGGHFVTGHVDTIGQISQMSRNENAIKIVISFPSAYTRYLVEKGSVTIDGISLTVFSVSSDSFTISLIPHSASMTTLASKKVGDEVNLEFDILAKYTEKLLTSRLVNTPHNATPSSGVTLDMLKQYGF